MKALRTLLTAVVLLAGAMTMNAQRMSTIAIQSNARFLTDRMAYTLGIHDPYLIDEIYRINYDYIWGVNDYLDDVALGYYYDDYMAVCEARDLALRTLLGTRLWNSILGYGYFHRPIVFVNRGWHFSVYDYDRYGAHRFYYHAPRPIARGYAGGHFFRGMDPRGGRIVTTAPHATPHATPHVAPHDRTHSHDGRIVNSSQPQTAQPQNHSVRTNGTSTVSVRSGSNLRSSSRTNAATHSAPATRSSSSSRSTTSTGTSRGNVGGGRR